MINVVSDPFILLDNFHLFLRSSLETFDSAMLITLVVIITTFNEILISVLCSGIDLDGNTIGLAPIGVMCRGSISAALTQDTGSSVASVASTAAHELGHIFNMGHDDGRKWSCIVGIRNYILITTSNCS